jgi:hypothetical protein
MSDPQTTKRDKTHIGILASRLRLLYYATAKELGIVDKQLKKPSIMGNILKRMIIAELRGSPFEMIMAAARA